MRGGQSSSTSVILRRIVNAVQHRRWLFAPARMHAGLALTAGTLALLLAFAVSPAPASSTGGEIELEIALETNELTSKQEPLLHATRVGVHLYGKSSPDSHARFEYSLTAGGPWSFACEESNDLTSEESGSHEPLGGTCLIRHLTPSTRYFARVVLTRSAGTAEASTTFTTTPVSAPEILNLALARANSSGIELGTTYANLEADLESNGAETKYGFEYSESPSGPWTPAPGGSGTITAAEDFLKPEVALRGLAPETHYYLRASAENAAGKTTREYLRSKPYLPPEPGFTTVGLEPGAKLSEPWNIGPNSARLTGAALTRSLESHWRFESAPSASGPWTPVAGGSGTISAAQAGESPRPITILDSGLSPATTYYVRFAVDNGHGESVSEPRSFQTAGPPRAVTFAAHTFVAGGETPRILGAVAPDTGQIDEVQSLSVAGGATGGSFTLSFEGDTTAAIPFGAGTFEVQQALAALASIGGSGNVRVEGVRGGPYEVRFGGSLGGRHLPALTGDGSGLSPSGSVTVATVEDGSSFDTRYRFEYVPQADFQSEGGFAGPNLQTTTEVDLGSGATESLASADLPGLERGVEYEFRLTANNTTSGNPVVHGAERTLALPAAQAQTAESCPNAALRSGPSAQLPDCRAYEQVTPVEKGGSPEMTKKAEPFLSRSVPGEDGDHFLFESSGVKWGHDPSQWESAYLFTRDPNRGWQMTSASAQPQSGIDSFVPSLVSPNLTETAMTVGWTTQANGSPDMSFETGPFGGPYTSVASMPRSQVPLMEWSGALNEGEHPTAWLGASRDFSKLVVDSGDRKLLGQATGTLSGVALYEYTSGGGLHQLNVSGGAPGKTVGSCGARLVRGYDSGAGARWAASPDALSSDGSRVFFEAAPGSECPVPSESRGGPRWNLYMRVDGSETVDIGAYRFLAGDAQDTTLLLEHANGGMHEVLSYDTETGKSTHLFTASETPEVLGVAEQFAAFYFTAEERLTPDASEPTGPDEYTDLYRYDLRGHQLSFIDGVEPGFSPEGDSVSANGNDFYFGAKKVAGVPGGGGEGQVFRYDNGEQVIQCMSCASPFNPEPRSLSEFTEATQGGTAGARDGMPPFRAASDNGDFVFFEAVSPLVPADIDGETPPNSGEQFTYNHPSTDVYEWRRDGVDRCEQAQGCLSLISGGQGGLVVYLLGTTPSGRDVFFTTNSALAPSDTDTASDVYDARIDGGFPVPNTPVECEGDACSTPESAPLDATPASSSFAGPGNASGSTTTQKPGGSNRQVHRTHAKKKRKAKPRKNLRGKRSAAPRYRAEGRRRTVRHRRTAGSRATGARRNGGIGR